MMSDTIRAVQREDLIALKNVIETTGLFPSELLDEMMAGYFENPDNKEIWLTRLLDKSPVAIAYCAPERMTEGTCNLYLIAVHVEFQGKGIGAEMMEFIESYLCNAGQRILLVETSGLPEYELTRRFYDQCGYTREAVIRDFYAEGEDKVVFWKKLTR